MKNKTLTAGDLDARIHYCMTYIGGFMGTYTIFSFAGSFGNAGTANMVSIFTNFFRGNIFTMMLKILGFLIYSLGITLAVWLPKHTIISTKMLSLKITCACAILLWLLPDTLPPTVGLYPTFFAMSFQWCCFHGAYGYGSSTIFCTNNIRQFVTGLVETYLNGNDEKLKIKFFGLTLLAFNLGVTTMCLLFTRFNFGVKSSVLVLVPAICGAYYIKEKEKLSKKELID